MAHRSYKYRIYPTKEQEVLIHKTFGCARFIYNKMLEDKINWHMETGKILYNSPAQYKKDYEWLKEVDSHALGNEFLEMDSKFKQFLMRPKLGYPKFKTKKFGKQSYKTNCSGTNIRLVNGKIRLPKVGFVKIKLYRIPPKDYRIKTVTISQTSSEKYYASISYEYERSEMEFKKPETFLGIDQSTQGLYVDSNGNKPNYPESCKLTENKIAKEQKRLSYMQKGSNNYKKQRIKIAKLYEKLDNQHRDFLHKQSRQIVNAYDCICIKNPDITQILQNYDSDKFKIWEMFTFFLSYKLRDQGKSLSRTHKNFPSSKLCSNCQYKNTKLKDLSIKEWTCPKCGWFHDRETNSAINIREEGKRLYKPQGIRGQLALLNI